jgi:hypothetical protein
MLQFGKCSLKSQPPRLSGKAKRAGFPPQSPNVHRSGFSRRLRLLPYACARATSLLSLPSIDASPICSSCSTPSASMVNVCGIASTPNSFATTPVNPRTRHCDHSFFFFHLLAHQRGMPGLRIDPSRHRQTTAGDRVGIFLLDDHAMFNGLGRVRRGQASYGRRHRTRRNRFLRPAASQNQTRPEQTSPETTLGPTNHPPSLLHAICFRSPAPACRWQS